MRHYDADSYWQSLLSGSFNLQGASWPDLSTGFLRWQYRARETAIRRVVPSVAGKRVLDVGPGTGYWVALWHRLGAASVAGFDLTAASVDHLTDKFPGDCFYQGDISAVVPPGGPYDLISAIDVLLHITDNDRYAAALENMRQAAHRGSRLVLLEPLSSGPPASFEAGSSSRARPIAMVRPLLAQSGWRVRAIHPALWLLTSPIETQPARLSLVLNWYWAHLRRTARHERIGAAAGATLYPLDRLLCRLPWGPTSRVLLAEAR
ncbi:MAG: class I SAM-dependent methyltransferase [Chloroflexota bacterium]